VTGIRRINIGCGATPTPGYANYDNSLSVWIANHPWLAPILSRGLSKHQRDFIELARAKDIRWADATKRIPVHDRSVDVLYTCHTLEHLDPVGAKLFLEEARRVLVRSGVIRIVVPDFAQQVAQYSKDHDVDGFLRYSNLTQPNPRSLWEKLRILVVGMRHHLWAYDAPSMSRLLSSMGFQNVRVLRPGETTIEVPGELDLYQRAEWSLFIEARNS
jgi:predicted SAM-dependent methyltransferase